MPISLFNWRHKIGRFRSRGREKSLHRDYFRRVQEALSSQLHKGKGIASDTSLLSDEHENSHSRTSAMSANFIEDSLNVPGDHPSRASFQSSDSENTSNKFKECAGASSENQDPRKPQCNYWRKPCAEAVKIKPGRDLKQSLIQSSLVVQRFKNFHKMCTSISKEVRITYLKLFS